jgi:low temperature requirement protein LtrA
MLRRIKSGSDEEAEEEDSVIDISESADLIVSSSSSSPVHSPPTFWGLSLNASLRESMVDLHLKKRFWRYPKLHWDSALPMHQEDPSKPHPEAHSRLENHRGEGWYELFYDLIFVAAALQIGHIVQSEITPRGLFKSGLLFTLMRATWDQLMFYQNRFDTKDMVHYFFYLLQAISAFVMANHLTLDADGNQWDRDSNMIPFTVAVALARISNAAMYSQIVSLSSSFHNHFTAVVISQILAAALYMLPAMFQSTEHLYYVYWLCALFVERTFVMVYIFFFTHIPLDGLSHRAPWHMGHLRHREVRLS